jgi:hypothetical protein
MAAAVPDRKKLSVKPNFLEDILALIQMTLIWVCDVLK